MGGIETFPHLRLAECSDLATEGAWLYFGQCVTFGNARTGEPIYIQRIGVAGRRFAEGHAYFGGDSAGSQAFLDRFVWMHELMLARMDEATARFGRPVTQQINIFDMRDLSFVPDSRALAVFKQQLAIDACHYPETLRLHFFVNAPAVFKPLWRMIRGWLDPVTAAKIHVLGSDFAPALLEHIDPDQLPREYGGTNDWDVLKSVQSRDDGEALACRLGFDVVGA